ncbi:hypothetical protein ACHQM5_029032 [Ranunculus cassubicifolius]
MQEPELHDLDDDSDYAASQQRQELRGISRMDSGKTNVDNESDEAEVVFLKDNVTIHPSQYASERISGRLRLIKHGPLLFMTWIPYKERADSSGQSTNARLSEKDRNLYTIRAVPVTDIRSIRRHTPTFGWQYLIIVLSSGLAFPPLYFYNGGVREFLATLKQHVFLVRSADDVNVFLVNDNQDPLQRSLTSLELPRAVSISNSASTPTLASAGPSFDISEGIDNKPSQTLPNNNQETESNDVQTVTNDTYVTPDPLEFDKLPLIWGQPRQPPLGSEEWATFLDAEGRVMDSKALRKRIFYGGLENEMRNEVWKFLLGYYDYNSTYAEREYLSSVKKADYETMKRQWQSISPDQAKRFTKFRERKGLIEKDVVRTDRSTSFYDGDDNPNVILLRDILLTYSFYNFDLGYCQGMSDLLSPILYIVKEESESFWCFVALMERLGPNFNRDQNGMHSQLFALSKLVELLDSPLHNYFLKNDCLNYFFCFRWVLIQFKREFDYEQMMRLWEVLWTHYLSEHFHLYVCVAILKKHRKKIMGEQMDFDTLLKFINELSGEIDLDPTLKDAEALCVCAGENGAACIPPGTPAALPIETELLYPIHDDDSDVL